MLLELTLVKLYLAFQGGNSVLFSSLCNHSARGFVPTGSITAEFTDGDSIE